MSEQRVATFWVGDLLLAVAVDRVQEVVHAQVLTPVPLSPDCVQGLFNFRGQIVTAIDVRCRLGLPERKPDEDSVNFIVLTEGDLMSLVVDRQGDVIDLDDHSSEVPPTVDPTIRSLVTGVHKVDETLLLLVDLDQMLTPASA